MEDRCYINQYPKLFYSILGIPLLGSIAYAVSNVESVPYTNRLHLCLLGEQQEQLLGARYVIHIIFIHNLLLVSNVHHNSLLYPLYIS